VKISEGKLILSTYISYDIGSLLYLIKVSEYCLKGKDNWTFRGLCK